MARCCCSRRTQAHTWRARRLCATAVRSSRSEARAGHMDFSLSPEVEAIRLKVRAFVEEHVLPLESDPHNFSEHENIPDERLAPVREKAKKAGLWAPQSPKE